jgi:predicted transcriptional regulator with HTH domain
MDYRAKLVSIFEKLYFINLSDLARHIGMDPSNLRNYSKGKLQISEEKYNTIIKGIEEFTEKMEEAKADF